MSALTGCPHSVCSCAMGAMAEVVGRAEERVAAGGAG